MITVEYNPLVDAQELLMNEVEALEINGNFVYDREIEINKRLIQFNCISRPVSCQRTKRIEKSFSEDNGDFLTYHMPYKLNDTLAHRKGCLQAVNYSDTFLVGFWFNTDKLLPALNFVEENKNDVNSEKFIKSNLIIDTLTKGPYISMVNYLQENTNKNVEIINNDVCIDGKKVTGAIEWTNSSGIFQLITIYYNYNDDIFKMIFNEKNYNEKVKDKMTGIKNEIDFMTKENFIVGTTDKFKILLNKVKDLV